jgi:FKBP-type peptidyl-prolyl cis-trans isomerase
MMFKRTAILVLCAAAASACGKSPATNAEETKPADAPDATAAAAAADTEKAQPAPGGSVDPGAVSQLKVEDLAPGTGEGAKDGDTVVVHYTGTLTNGKKFDSSVDRGKPFPVKLGARRVIPGWEQGLKGMKTGGKRKLTIPPHLAYGPKGAGGVIPPNATLIFEIEMIEIKPGAAPAAKAPAPAPGKAPAKAPPAPKK